MPTQQTEEMLDLMTAATVAGITRERLLRKIQVGEVRGERINGRWFCVRGDVKRLAAGVEPRRTVAHR